MNVKKCVRALLCLYLTLIIAMDAVKAQALKVGDTIPPELWSMPLDVINHPSGKDCITLDEYKGKLIILDFWATWCSPCIAMLPKQDSLQKQFKDRLQILPVTYQTGEEVSTFMEKYEKRKGVKNSLPKVVGDKVLRAAFPHTYLPHYVWIDVSGTVKAITGYKEVNADKIKRFINNNNISNITKTDKRRIPFDKSKPLLIEGNGNSGQSILYYSILTGFAEGLGSGYSIRFDSSSAGILTLRNVALHELYQIAYGADSVWFGNNRTSIKIKDIKRIKYIDNSEEYSEWIKRNAYSYQLILSNSTRERLFNTLSKDLNTLFPEFECIIEKRESLCWVISLKPDCHIPIAEPVKGYAHLEPIGYTMRNASINAFINDMNVLVHQNSPFPIINDTNLNYNIDLDLESRLSDMEALAKEFESKGFSLTKENRDINVLVLRDKPVRKI